MASENHYFTMNGLRERKLLIQSSVVLMLLALVFFLHALFSSGLLDTEVAVTQMPELPKPESWASHYVFNDTEAAHIRANVNITLNKTSDDIDSTDESSDIPVVNVEGSLFPFKAYHFQTILDFDYLDPEDNAMTETKDNMIATIANISANVNFTYDLSQNVPQNDFTSDEPIMENDTANSLYYWERMNIDTFGDGSGVTAEDVPTSTDVDKDTARSNTNGNDTST